ncbi:dolichol kinase [Parcubacteria bacterium DG_74_2]|nr:MAG: dolichol kinase [Parcubacteria bacterium DG_74_2]
MITKTNIFYDLILSIPIFLWVLFITQFLSKWVSNFAIKKGYPKDSATYFGRKIIHIFASGVVALLLPFFFKEPLTPFLMAILLAVYTYLPHRMSRLFDWFQVKENIHEVNFCLMWGIVVFIGWFFDKSFWLGVIPALFMSFGDGITGIVRNLRYQKRTKAWEGSLAMLFTCILIGLKMGWAGIVAAIFATIFEKFEFIDDNISIPIVSFLVLLFFFIFYPQLAISIW